MNIPTKSGSDLFGLSVKESENVGTVTDSVVNLE